MLTIVQSTGTKFSKSIAGPPKAPGIPKRGPDYTFHDVTTPEQAAIYRLSGDYNPLHIGLLCPFCILCIYKPLISRVTIFFVRSRPTHRTEDGLRWYYITWPLYIWFRGPCAGKLRRRRRPERSEARPLQFRGPDILLILQPQVHRRPIHVARRSRRRPRDPRVGHRSGAAYCGRRYARDSVRDTDSKIRQGIPSFSFLSVRDGCECQCFHYRLCLALGTPM
jgi:hypothetical protein